MVGNAYSLGVSFLENLRWREREGGGNEGGFLERGAAAGGGMIHINRENRF